MVRLADLSNNNVSDSMVFVVDREIEGRGVLSGLV